HEYMRAEAMGTMSEPGADALDGLFGLLARAERREAEVALAARTEAGARHAHHVGLGQQRVEEVPRRRPGRRAQPDVRRVATAVDRVTGGAQPLADDPRVRHVVIDQRAHLLLSLGGEHGGAGLLDEIRRALEL